MSHLVWVTDKMAVDISKVAYTYARVDGFLEIGLIGMDSPLLVEKEEDKLRVMELLNLSKSIEHRKVEYTKEEFRRLLRELETVVSSNEAITMFINAYREYGDIDRYLVEVMVLKTDGSLNVYGRKS